MLMLRALLILAVASWAVPLRASDPQGGGAAEPAEAGSPLVQALIGTATSILLHELAHALIGETDLPATGPEEDVADAFSALVLTRASARTDDVAARKMTEYGVLYWYYSGLKQRENEAGADDWQGEHAADLRRFRNSFCLIYGLSPELFSQTADRVGLTGRTRARCIDEAAKQYEAWGAILETIRRPEGAPGGRIRLAFEDSSLLAGQIIKTYLGDTGRMRASLDVFERTLALPRDISVTFADCPQYNAWYDPGDGSITLCYRLFDLTAATVLDGLGITGTSAPAPQPAPEARTAPQPAPGGDRTPAMRFLTGTWTATYTAGNGQAYQAVVIYEPDGRYGLRYEGPYGPVMVAGRWSAFVNADTVVMIRNEPERWEPRELCNAQGECTPNDQQASTFPVDLIDADTVAVDGLRWSRAPEP